MANLSEQSIWETGVYQIEENDPVHGGANGITNRPIKQLANRTVWLKNELASSVQAINANLANLSDNKAEKTTNITAGNGLTGGGTLQANRTLTLGTPSQITATSTNAVTATSHTHAIDKATDAQAGVVMLSHLTDGTDKSKAASEYALGEVRRLANQAQASANGISLTWNSITGKPSLFPPSSHTHTISQISGLQSELNNKANANHIHHWNDITNKPSSFNPSHHTHPWSQITGVPSASTSSSGVVLLSNSLSNSSTTQAATANTVKLLNDNKLDKTNVITNASQITTGDLNNYTRPGYYYCSSGSHATNIRNTPVNRAFSLEITQTDGVIQTFKEAHNANVWIRTYNSYWDEWKKLAATTDNVSSATRLQNARTISLTGALSGSASFDGSSNISLYSTIRTATTSVAGIVQLNNSTDSTSTTQAATANALKSAYDLAFAANSNANGRVSRNGSETIYGVKTFDASPKAPTPHFATNDTTVATTAFVKSIANGTFSNSENGYQILPSGLIIQWGSVAGGTNNKTITFPILFPNQILSISLTLKVRSRDYDAQDSFGVFDVSDSNFKVFNWVDPSQGCYWIAIGY